MTNIIINGAFNQEAYKPLYNEIKEVYSYIQALHPDLFIKMKADDKEDVKFSATFTVSVPPATQTVTV